MTRNDDNTLGYRGYAILTTVVSAIFLVGVRAGYKLGKQYCDEYQPLPSSQREAICELAVAPLRRDFIKNCNSKNFDRGNLLKSITEQRDNIFEQYKCEAQEWKCTANEPSDLEQGFHAEFGYK